MVMKFPLSTNKPAFPDTVHINIDCVVLCSCIYNVVAMRNICWPWVQKVLYAFDFRYTDTVKLFITGLNCKIQLVYIPYSLCPIWKMWWHNHFGVCSSFPVYCIHCFAKSRLVRIYDKDEHHFCFCEKVWACTEGMTRHHSVPHRKSDSTIILISFV